jgi:hypothetical protein
VVLIPSPSQLYTVTYSQALTTLSHSAAVLLSMLRHVWLAQGILEKVSAGGAGHCTQTNASEMSTMLEKVVLVAPSPTETS